MSTPHPPGGEAALTEVLNYGLPPVSCAAVGPVDGRVALGTDTGDVYVFVPNRRH